MTNSKSKLPTNVLIESTNKSAVEASNNALVERLLDERAGKESEISSLKNNIADKRAEIIRLENELKDAKENGEKVFVYKTQVESSVNPYAISNDPLTYEGREAVAKIRADINEKLEKKYKEELEKLDSLEHDCEMRVKAAELANEKTVDELKIKLNKKDLELTNVKSEHNLTLTRREMTHDDNKRRLEMDYNRWKKDYNKKMANLKEELTNLKEKGIATTIERELKFYRERATSFLGRLFMPKFNPLVEA